MSMETQTQRLMPAKAVKDEDICYGYLYEDGFRITLSRHEGYPEQINLAVYGKDNRTISEMLVWAREAKKE